MVETGPPGFGSTQGRPPGATSDEGAAQMLQLTDIRRDYRIGPVTTEILRGVDLAVGAGDLMSIMGPSGSGKTTLMNIIGLLDRPTSGRYVLDGRDVSKLADDDLAMLRNAHIGFVFQSFQLLPRLTAVENVSLPLVYRGTNRAEMRRRALAALERVGMGERTGHRPDQLSGGQKQRVAIARALVGEPAVVLADEPTGALDGATAREVMALLASLNAEHKVTILIITHDPGVARQCARQVRIHEGTLVERTAGAPGASGAAAARHPASGTEETEEDPGASSAPPAIDPNPAREQTSRRDDTGEILNPAAPT
ncbi:MAG: ABC transporter ATP-binding protein [Thiotrichales bacterium]|nr:ABC transporter ATP-binding protein [Thiotrichales bacterium]